jgi:transposase
MARKDELSDEQWAIIEPLIPPYQAREDGKGRPRIHDDRSVINGILWVLRTGACWSDLPDRYPSSSTCYRRFSHWVNTGILRKILETLARDLEQRGGIDLEECFIDGTFVVAKKGGAVLERPSGARVRSSWLLSTLLVYHSVCTRLLLHHMKSPLSRLRSMRPSRWDDPEELSGIVPTILIRSIKDSGKKGALS